MIRNERKGTVVITKMYCDAPGCAASVDVKEMGSARHGWVEVAVQPSKDVRSYITHLCAQHAPPAVALLRPETRKFMSDHVDGMADVVRAAEDFGRSAP